MDNSTPSTGRRSTYLSPARVQTIGASSVWTSKLKHSRRLAPETKSRRPRDRLHTRRLSLTLGQALRDRTQPERQLRLFRPSGHQIDQRRHAIMPHALVDRHVVGAKLQNLQVLEGLAKQRLGVEVLRR